MISRKTLLAALLGLAAVSAQAQPAEKKKPVVTPPPPPEELLQQEDAPAEPQVTIVQREWARITEYSYAGQVYAVRIDPASGPTYYLYDSDADGSLETRRNLGEDMPELNQWKILTW